MVRCFVGLFLTEQVKAYILSLQHELRKINLDCKFVEEQNMHVSLSFIGDVDERRVEEIKNSLMLLEKFKKFSVKIGKIRLIPNEKFIRVIVVDAAGEEMKKLQDVIVDLVGGDAKPPHITLCRIRSPLMLSQIEMLKSIKTSEIELDVDSVDLIRSTITYQGPVYESMSKYKFV